MFFRVKVMENVRDSRRKLEKVGIDCTSSTVSRGSLGPSRGSPGPLGSVLRKFENVRGSWRKFEKVRASSRKLKKVEVEEG